jgi:hypothetical protein
MSNKISQATLTAIQKAGAAVFSADERLKEEVRKYADRVNKAVTDNPFGLGNDTLFENWKTAARLSLTLVGIEDELKKIYQTASELTIDDQSAVQDLLKLAPPVKSNKKSQTHSTAVVDAKVKRKKRVAKKSSPALAASSTTPNINLKGQVAITQQPAPKSKKTPSQRKSGVGDGKPTVTSKTELSALSGNPALLLQHLRGLLNANQFNPINQAEISLATAIPKGSMAAALKSLKNLGHLQVGPDNKSYKLTGSQAEPNDQQTLQSVEA